MNALPSRLAQLEARLQSLIEGSAARLFPGRNAPHHLTHQLLQAMQRGVHPGADGILLAPNLYRLIAHPDYAVALRSSPAFLSELADLLRSASLEAGLTVSGPLQVRVEPDARLAVGEVQVMAFDSLQDLTPTHGLRVASEPSNDPPRGAFLIVNGTSVVPLDGSVVNIGRRPDNQLVIDDPRISRLHAQLRLVRGRFVLFDLDSTGGSFVNGQRVTRHMLSPGDVVSLAGVPLIYGQDGDDRVDTIEMNVE